MNRMNRWLWRRVRARRVTTPCALTVDKGAVSAKVLFLHLRELVQLRGSLVRHRVLRQVPSEQESARDQPSLLLLEKQ